MTNEEQSRAIKLLIDAQEVIYQLKSDAPIISTIEDFLIVVKPGHEGYHAKDQTAI